MFIPGTSDPSSLDLSMRSSLADSLAYVVETVGRRLDIPRAHAERAIAAVRLHRVVPAVFGQYYKLVMAVHGGDYGQACSALRRIVDVASRTPTFGVDLYTEASLGEDRQLYGELIDPDAGSSPWLCPPPPTPDFSDRVRDSFALIAKADAALGTELRGLAIQVVGASPFHGPDARPFGSVSSLMLWGLLVVNVERYGTAVALVQGLVHEAAHLLLFAHSVEEPFVTNAIEERYTSPLRSDPRPMDGVFHATFVAARMHYSLRRLREVSDTSLEPIAVESIDRQLQDIQALYFGGLQTVRKHAKLTGTGQRIIEESLDYMQAA